MEYRRRRKPKYQSKYQPKHAGAYPAYLIGAAVFLAIVYCIAASRAAGWAAERWIAPLLAPKAETQQAPFVAEPETDAAQNDAAEITAELPAYTCYALQIGSYEDEANANKQADALQKLGAAGYMELDGTRYRVLASGYGERTSAETVVRQLASEGIEAYIYTIACAAVDYTLAGDASEAEAVCAALSCVTETLEQLNDAAIAFDREEDSVQEGAAVVQALYDGCAAQSRTLHSIADDAEGHVNRLRTFYETLLRDMEQVYVQTDLDKAAFSSLLKGLYLSAVEARRALSAA